MNILDDFAQFYETCLKGMQMSYDL